MELFRVLGVSGQAVRGATFDFTPDGRRFLVIVPAEGGEHTSMQLTLNWPALLEK